MINCLRHTLIIKHFEHVSNIEFRGREGFCATRND